MRSINFIPWMVFLIFIGGVFWGIYQYPPVHDTWGHVHDLKWYERSWSHLFIFNYFQDNPRIGQVPLQVFGGTPLGRSFLGGTSILLLIFTAFVLCMGRMPRLNPEDGAMILWLMVSILTLGAMPGKMIYYIPYNANYVLGLALLLAFLIPYRFAYVGKHLAGGALSILMVPLGLAAGMSNEHTVPAVLIGLPAALFIREMIDRRLVVERQSSAQSKAWQIVGYLSLAVGYAALYFAPGQSLRYGEGRKELGFSLLINSFSERTSVAARMLWEGAMPLFVVLAIALSIFFIRRGGAKLSSAALILATFFVSGLIAITTLASPLIAPRLLFASSFFFALGCGVLLVQALKLNRRWHSLTVTLLSLIILSVSINNWAAISRFSSAFKNRALEVQHQVQQGRTTVVVSPYDLAKLGPASIIHLDGESLDADNWTNIPMARFFGVMQISVAE